MLHHRLLAFRARRGVLADGGAEFIIHATADVGQSFDFLMRRRDASAKLGTLWTIGDVQFRHGGQSCIVQLEVRLHPAQIRHGFEEYTVAGCLLVRTHQSEGQCSRRKDRLTVKITAIRIYEWLTGSDSCFKVGLCEGIGKTLIFRRVRLFALVSNTRIQSG